MALARGYVRAEVVYETSPDNIHQTGHYIRTSLKGSCRNLKNGAVIVSLYDVDDNLVGRDITGSPSDALQEMAESLYEEEDTDASKEGMR